MKIDRLLAIVTILLQREQVTAPQLAERLEVSRRTIGRDIDALCRAGIPIVTRQGGGGGISIAEGYKLDKSVLTRGELQSILTGLRSLHTVGGGENLQNLLQKLSPAGERLSLQENVIIDLSSHYRESLSHKIGLLREAISAHRTVSFLYYSPGGRARREVEPCVVVFQWSDWYVLGYCRLRQDFRLFKLGRLWELENTGRPFSPRPLPPEKLDFHARFADGAIMEILFDPRAEYRIVETYGPDSYTVGEGGWLHLRRGFTDRAHIKRWILGFGSQARVLAPTDLAREVEEEIQGMAGHYRTDSNEPPRCISASQAPPPDS